MKCGAGIGNPRSSGIVKCWDEIYGHGGVEAPEKILYLAEHHLLTMHFSCTGSGLPYVFSAYLTSRTLVTDEWIHSSFLARILAHSSPEKHLNIFYLRDLPPSSTIHTNISILTLRTLILTILKLVKHSKDHFMSNQWECSLMGFRKRSN